MINSEIVEMVSPSGNPEIIPQIDVEARIAQGYIMRDAWNAAQTEIAEKEYQKWLASPEGINERFERLRLARDELIAATDFLMTIDYPLSEENRNYIIAYRQALRDMPAKEGAPWDGGGALTPWPIKPDLINS